MLFLISHNNCVTGIYPWNFYSNDSECFVLQPGDHTYIHAYYKKFIKVIELFSELF
jgi:hypothetical protein